MPRSLDMSSLRSFLTIAETGGVTRAANTLNLTQSAVSMQMKRLEEALDVSLFDRSGRQMALTGAGEQLLSYARRIIELNDEAVMRLTTKEFEGELTFGVPHDIVYPHIPAILHRLNQEFPRVKVHLISSYTTDLKARLAERSIDLILTTEPDKTAQSECLVTLPLVWVGAQNGTAWRHRPLRLAFEQTCIFRKLAQTALEASNIPWDLAVETESDRTVAATVSADLAVHVAISGTPPQHMVEIDHGGALPPVGETNINMYLRDGANSPAITHLADQVRRAYRGMPVSAPRAIEKAKVAAPM